MKRNVNFKLVALTWLALAALPLPVFAQVAGPIAPPPKFEAKKIPPKPEPGAPPLPAEEIIHRFTANEDLIKKAFDDQSYDQSVKVEELVDNGGQFDFIGQVYTKPGGDRYVRVVKPPVSNLKYTEFSLEDVKTVDGFPLFILNTSQLPSYDLSYEGQEKLDEISAFIFRVKPKQLGKQPLFDGVVWIDDQDFAIVKTYGQFVTEAGNSPASFPFTMFEMYRENLQGHLWFPTYLRSDTEVKTPQGEVPIRLVVRSTNFKPEVAASPAPSTPHPPASQKPSSRPSIR
jgi:hypothetical protein